MFFKDTHSERALKVQYDCWEIYSSFIKLSPGVGVLYAVGIFYVYLVFLVCYLPYVIGLAVFEIAVSNITLKKLHISFTTIVFLNSSLNPVIYCWKMRHIRHAVMNILSKMFQRWSSASQETPALAGNTMP